MLTRQDLKTIFKQKKQRTKTLKDKNGNLSIKLIHGFEEVTLDQFVAWFDEAMFKQGCYYCGTTNERSFELYQLQRQGHRPDATRGGKRSKRLELDRKNPNLPYDNLDNVVWCCYWCNNAKSNFFTEAEFKPIALAIGASLSRI